MAFNLNEFLSDERIKEFPMRIQRVVANVKGEPSKEPGAVSTALAIQARIDEQDNSKLHVRVTVKVNAITDSKNALFEIEFIAKTQYKFSKEIPPEAVKDSAFVKFFSISLYQRVADRIQQLIEGMGFSGVVLPFAVAQQEPSE